MSYQNKNWDNMPDIMNSIGYNLKRIADQLDRIADHLDGAPAESSIQADTLYNALKGLGERSNASINSNIDKESIERKNLLKK